MPAICVSETSVASVAASHSSLNGMQRPWFGHEDLQI
jgi:hypothetical protein